MNFPENEAPSQRCCEQLRLYAETGNALHAWGALHAWLELRDEYPKLPFPMPQALAKYLLESAKNIIDLTEDKRPQAYQNGHPLEGSRTQEHLQPKQKLELLAEALQLRGGKAGEWNAFKAYKHEWDRIYVSTYEATLKEHRASKDQRSDLMKKITHIGSERGQLYKKNGGRGRNPPSPFLLRQKDTNGER